MRQDKPSKTAVWIIKGILYLNTVYPKLSVADPRAISLFKNCLRWLNDAFWIRKIQFSIYRLYFKTVEHITVPGIFVHYVLRKKKINEWMKSAIEQGSEQIIILAAGFDALAQVSCESYPSIKFIEIDHPATQKVKVKAIKSLNNNDSSIVFIDCDLSQNSLISILTKNKIDPNLKTFFIFEGLTMYLTENEVMQLFNDIRTFFQNGLQVAFTYMEQQKDGSFQFMNTTILTLIWLMINRESFKWGIRPEILKNDFLPKLGFEVIEMVKTVEINDMFENEKVAMGEDLCLIRPVGPR